MIDLALPSDLQVTIFLIVISLIISFVVFLRNKLLAIIIFSVLSNASLLLNIDSEMFYFNNIEWLQYFSIFVWPVINIILIGRYLWKKFKN